VLRMLYSPEFQICAQIGNDQLSEAGEVDPIEAELKTEESFSCSYTSHDEKDANRISMSRGLLSPSFRLPRLHSGGKFLWQQMPRPRVMSFHAVLALLWILLVPAWQAHAQSAKTWNNRARSAEVREDYDTSYEDYRQAHLKSPADLRYKASMERVRFQAGASHVDRGRVLRQSGDLTGAMTEFNRALTIDPSDQAAQQELDIAQRQLQSLPFTSGPGSAVTQRSSDSLNAISSISGIVELKPVSNDPLTLHMVEDTKVIYQAIGKAAGINVLFDPDYTSKRIPIDLTNVSLSDALRIVGTIAGTFTKTVTSNTIFVARMTIAFCEGTK